MASNDIEFSSLLLKNKYRSNAMEAEMEEKEEEKQKEWASN